MLAHNSVDRDLMARDSIELNLDEQARLPGKPSRVRNHHQAEQDGRLQSRAAALREQRRAQPRAAAVHNEGDSELLINPNDLDLEELDNEEAQFLRTDRRVPVRRSAIPKKAANQLKIAGAIAGVVVLGGILSGWAVNYGRYAARFRISSSDVVEISGVHNASRAHVMEAVAGDALGRNIFSISLEDSKAKLEQLPWVEQATVMRLLPNRIAVNIKERTPVAFAQIGSRISLIDANGAVMGLPADRKIKYSFPVIRGIAETEPLSSRVAVMKIYNRLVSELRADTTSSANPGTNYVQQLSEVDLSDPENVKVTANDPGGTMVVHLGSADFLPHYKLYVTHIAEWRQQFPNLQSVDLRYEGQVVVNPDKLAAGSPVKPSPVLSTDNTEKKKSLTWMSDGNADRKKPAGKAAIKPVSHKGAKPAKKKPQSTQRAQR